MVIVAVDHVLVLEVADVSPKNRDGADRDDGVIFPRLHFFRGITSVVPNADAPRRHVTNQSANSASQQHILLSCSIQTSKYREM